MQKKELSAAEGQEMTRVTVRTLKGLRTAERFEDFFKSTTSKAQSFEVQEPCLPRKKRVPARYEVGTGQPEFHDSAKDHYRQIYYEARDLIINCITDRFEQVDYRMYANCEQLLLKAANNEDYSDEIENVTSFYGSDFQPASLQAQLVNFTSNYPREDGVKASLKDIIDYFKNLSASHRALIPQVKFC